MHCPKMHLDHVGLNQGMPPLFPIKKMIMVIFFFCFIFGWRESFGLGDGCERVDVEVTWDWTDYIWWGS